MKKRVHFLSNTALSTAALAAVFSISGKQAKASEDLTLVLPLCQNSCAWLREVYDRLDVPETISNDERFPAGTLEKNGHQLRCFQSRDGQTIESPSLASYQCEGNFQVSRDGSLTLIPQAGVSASPTPVRKLSFRLHFTGETSAIIWDHLSLPEDRRPGSGGLREWITKYAGRGKVNCQVESNAPAEERHCWIDVVLFADGALVPEA